METYDSSGAPSQIRTRRPTIAHVVLDVLTPRQSSVHESEIIVRQFEELKPKTNSSIPLFNRPAASKLRTRLHYIYEKFGFGHLMPVVILVAYSFLGGAIFYAMETSGGAKSPQIVNKSIPDCQSDDRLIDDFKDVIQEDELFIASTEQVVTRVWELKNDSKGYNRAEVSEKMRMALDWYLTQIEKILQKQKDLLEKLEERKTGQLDTNLAASFEVQQSIRNGEIGYKSSVSRPITDLWLGIYYCMTIFTTIGYGNIAPGTDPARLVTMLYAIIGIPLLFIILNDFGDVISRHLIKIWCWWIKTARPAIYWFCQSPTLTLRRKKAAKLGEDFSSADSNVSKTSKSTDKEDVSLSSDNSIDKLHNLPMTVALGLTVGWMLMCAAIFCIWEDWSYFDGFYFFFVSLTTIGLGDRVPKVQHINYLMISFWLLLIGLSLVSMCIQVAQAKVEFLMQQMLVRVSKASQQAQLAGLAISDTEMNEVAETEPQWMKTLLGLRHRKRLERELKKKVTLTVVGTQTDPIQIQDQETQTLPTPDLRPIFWEQKETISRLMGSVRELEEKLQESLSESRQRAQNSKNNSNNNNKSHVLCSCNGDKNVPLVHKPVRKLPLKEVHIHSRHTGANLDAGKELLAEIGTRLEECRGLLAQNP